MARPHADVLIELSDGTTTDKLLTVKAVYALTYQGQLVAIKRCQSVSWGMSSKYPKTYWPNEGTARNRVKKLNEQYMTEDFGYICLHKNPDKPTIAVTKPAKRHNYEAN